MRMRMGLRQDKLGIKLSKAGFDSKAAHEESWRGEVKHVENGVIPFRKIIALF